MAILRSLFYTIVATISMTAGAAAADLRVIDEHLHLWDQFAQGNNSLVPKMKETWPKAKESLIRALNEKDPRAPSRVVFLILVQVGTPMPVESETGRAWGRYVGDKFPSHQVRGENLYLPWDFYAWWQRNKSPAHDLPLLNEWLSRDFAKKTVLPMYEAQLKSGSK